MIGACGTGENENNTSSVKADYGRPMNALWLGLAPKGSVLDMGGMAAIFHSLSTTYLDNREVMRDIERSLLFRWWIDLNGGKGHVQETG